MGYTHHFSFERIKGQSKNDKGKLDLAYQRAILDCQRIVRQYQREIGGLQGYSAHCAIGRYSGIGVNGAAGEDCDDFALREYLYQNESNQWVKTKQYSYDLVVTACLAVLKHRLGDAMQVLSDGERSDWTQGVALARKVTGLKILNPIPHASRQSVAKLSNCLMANRSAGASALGLYA